LVTVYPFGTTTTFGPLPAAEHVAAPSVSAALPKGQAVPAGIDTP
jgi:hypothetical protein